jgi:hypothetical protein
MDRIFNAQRGGRGVAVVLDRLANSAARSLRSPKLRRKPYAIDEEITLKSSSTLGRRRFIRLTAVGLAAAPLAAAFTSENALAADALSETDPQASALGYKMDATKASNRKDAKAVCSNCNFYTGAAGAANGPCTLFAGKLVTAKGWCTAWVKKA